MMYDEHMEILPPPEEITLDGVTEDEAILIIKDLLEWELSEYNYEGLKEFFFNAQGAYYFSNPTTVEDMMRYKKEYVDSSNGLIKNWHPDFFATEVRDLHIDHYRPTEEKAGNTSAKYNLSG